MKINQQKTNWILDTLLFIGFLVAFAMDWTGLPAHQWIGVFGGLLATYHLLLHWDWVTAVTMRFFGKTSGQARTYYILDAAIMVGFCLIVITGIFISTWLNLALTNYAAWADFHVTTSIVTLILVVLKISLHSRWIMRVARQSIFHPAPQSAPVFRTAPVLKSAMIPATTSGAMTRRDFLKLMGIVGIASLAAVSFTLDDNQKVQTDTTETDSPVPQDVSAAQPTQASVTETNPTASSVSQNAPTAQPTEASVTEINPTAVTVPQTYPSSNTTTTTSCTVQCNRRCSFPGNCHRYRDANGNNLCDFGECA